MVVEKVFAVIAESTRRDILEALVQESKAVGQLVDELGVSQPTVSKHLRVLREAGVVTMQAQGQKRFYSINTKPLALVSAWLDGLGAGIAAAPHAAATHATDTRATAQRSATPRAAATPAATPGVPSLTTPAASTPAAPTPAATATPATPAVTGAPAAAAAVVLVGGEHEGTVQQQITRSVGRAANKAADLLANLPTFRRRKD